MRGTEGEAAHERVDPLGVGALVMHKAGGPAMLVMRVVAGQAICEWFRLSGCRDRAAFPLMALVPVKCDMAGQRPILIPQNDPVTRFLDAFTVREAGSRTQSSALHALFVAWCKVNGEREWSQKAFSLAMRERGYRSKNSNVIWWLDLRIVDEAQR